jgi:hypothetical protein
VSAQNMMSPVPVDKGLFYHGRPKWLSHDLIAGLVEESDRMRGDAVQIKRQHHVAAGAQARRFANSAELKTLVDECAGVQAGKAGPANYLYYEQPGDGIDPHVDHDQFALNVILMLRHVAEERRRSALVLFPEGPDTARRFYLEPGELVVFHSGGVLHARSNLGPREGVQNLGIGFTVPEGFQANVNYWRP